MSLLHLAFAYLWHRRLVTGLSVFTVALGVALTLLVIAGRREIERNFLQQVQHYDLIAGTGGSEVALVLTALFHADQPRGNIWYRNYEQIRGQRGVLAAFPLNLGDHFKGAPVVGTVPEFLQQTQAGGAPLFPLAAGRVFQADFEVTVGADAARRHGLSIGDTLTTAHGAGIEGVEHARFPYVVVGILAPSGTAHDRALFTSLASYWKVHEEQATRADASEREVTLVLVRTVRPLVFQVQEALRRQIGVMAVRPAEVLQRMFSQVVQPLQRLLLGYGYAVALVAALSILATLFLSTLVRRRELALLRALGAMPREVFVLVVLEAAVLLVVGAGMGVLLSRLAMLWLAYDLEGRFGVSLDIARFYPGEAWALVSILLGGFLAAIGPAVHAYYSDPASGLARG